ncbi:MAG: hypothetical protein LBR23_10125 [Spirochaetaceae bacterium]|jgi:hypothetical protein|nr:hypothetical protein [Spirochaetaceae bacterium]
MLREMTITVDEALYNSLQPMVEQRTIGDLLADFLRTQKSKTGYTQAELEAGYRAMAADVEYERQAAEWCNGLMGGVDDETR